MNSNVLLLVVFIITLCLCKTNSRLYLVVPITVDRLGDAKDQVNKRL